MNHLGVALGVGLLVLAACTTSSSPEPTSQMPASSMPGFEPSLAPQPRVASECDSNYAGGCVPIVAYDLDCPDIAFRVQVIGVDIHKFDRDLDGYGCETNG